MQQNPKPKTVALVGADAEFGKNGTEGGRDNAKAAGLSIVYDQRYPPNTTDFAPIARSIAAANPDLVYAASYPTDTIGLIRAASEIGLVPKMFGGSMIGTLATVFRVQLGPLLNGMVVTEVFPPSFDYPGLKPMLAKYQDQAKSQGIDPLGLAFVPFGYAAAQILAQAVEATKSLDHEKLAAYMHKSRFATVAGDIAFGADGEWAKPVDMYVQFHDVTNSGIDQFRDGSHETILWPAAQKTGDIIYPFSTARK
jgi:branched-chain amino acid transport system substrate-binding protein